MLLTGPILKKYLPEIQELFKKELGEKLQIDFATIFGVFKGKELQAAATVKCYYGHWYMRADVVKPKNRGQGLQRLLIQERIEFLKGKTNIVKASIEPWNTYSSDNYEILGFEVWKKKKLNDGRVVNVYQKDI